MISAVVTQFIFALRALAPHDRLVAIREFGRMAEDLQDEALEEARHLAVNQPFTITRG